MKDGICPRCNANTVYRKPNGVTSGQKYIFVHTSRLSPRSDALTYVCTTCGFFENYIMDASQLEKVAQKWERA